MAKLWQKNYSLDLLMQHFTVRNDYILDQELLISDVVASIAHATMLNKINILSNSELEELKQGLNEIIEKKLTTGFEIKEEDEDCHTAIEGYLSSRFGETGKTLSRCRHPGQDPRGISDDPHGCGADRAGHHQSAGKRHRSFRKYPAH